MNVKVIKKFIDKETGAVRLAGSLFECTEKRFKEIEKAGHFVEAVIEKKKAEKSAE